MFRKLLQKIKTIYEKRQINLVQENVENSHPSSRFNNLILNPETFNYKSVVVYVTAWFAMIIHVYIFRVNGDNFSSEFHYYMNDQFLHFVFSIYIPLTTYALNKSLRTFVKDEFFWKLVQVLIVLCFKKRWDITNCRKPKNTLCWKIIRESNWQWESKSQ